MVSVVAMVVIVIVIVVVVVAVVVAADAVVAVAVVAATVVVVVVVVLSGAYLVFGYDDSSRIQLFGISRYAESRDTTAKDPFIASAPLLM